MTKIIKRLLKRPQAQKYGQFFIRKIATAFSLDLLTLAYRANGIMNSRNQYESGEHYLLSTWLKLFLSSHAINKPRFFDVGANVGDYSNTLSSLYPHAEIYAFEPNFCTFNQLQTLSRQVPNVYTMNIALGSAMGDSELFYREANSSSMHATLYKDVLTQVHGYGDVQTMDVSIDTLDHFCQGHNIEHIDFLKIDTEGHELEVLLGAKNLLKAGRVSSIQFEFNKMNTFSRVFLRDFVELLPDFNLYRLLPMSLLPIKYASKHEIFLFQNILAVRKTLDPYTK